MVKRDWRSKKYKRVGKKLWRTGDGDKGMERGIETARSRRS